MKSGIKVVAFTTALRFLYRRDSINAVCYPENWRLQLTYRKKWMSETVFESLKSNLLKDEFPLFVYWDVEDAGNPKPTDSLRFVPLRVARIEHTEVLRDADTAPIAMIHLELLGGPPRQISSPTFEEMAGFYGLCLPQPKTNGEYVVLTPERALPMDGESVSWHEQVEMLRSCGPFSSTRFLRISAFETLSDHGQAKGGPALLSPIEPLVFRGADITAFKLDAGTDYKISFYLPGFMSDGHHRVAVRTDRNLIDISECVVSQAGPGVQITHMLRVLRQYRTEHATLVASCHESGSYQREPRSGSIKTDPDAEDQAVEGVDCMGPEFQAYLEIAPRWRFWAFAAVALFLSAFLLNVDQEAVRGVSRLFMVANLLPGFLVSMGVAAWVAISKGLGALIFSVTALLVLRRLPFKL